MSQTIELDKAETEAAMKEDGAVYGVIALPPEPVDDGSEAPFDERNEDVAPMDESDILRACARARAIPVLEWGEVRRPWMRRFLNALAFRPVIAFACRSSRVSDDSVQKWRKADPAFDEQVIRALSLGGQTVEEAAYTRAVDGVPRAIFGKQDQVIGIEMKYSDSLTERLLEATQPEKYGRKHGPLVNINAVAGLDTLLASIVRPGLPQESAPPAIEAEIVPPGGILPAD